MKVVRVADIALDPRSGGKDALYTYEVDKDARPGDAFFVPLGPRQALGYATRVYDATEETLDFPLKSLRRTLGKVEGIGLPTEIMQLAEYLSQEYLCSLPVALTASTPPGVRDRLNTVWELTTEGQKALTQKSQETPLTPLQREVLQTLKEAGGKVQESKGKKLAAGVQRALRLLQGKDLVTRSQQITPFGEKRAQEQLFSITLDTDKVEEFLQKHGKKKPAQALTLLRLQSAETTRLTTAEIKAMAGVTDSTVKALINAGLIEQVEGKKHSVGKAPTPNAYQQIAIEAILEPIAQRQYQPFLLFGVTGSGKTEVYLRAAAETLRHGRKVLYLVPEIALAVQAITLLRERFGRGVAVLHSDLSPSERLLNWMRVRSGEASVVLGPRSALFAPMENIGLIILDEEHEASYKQESAPRYHTKHLAKYLGQLHKCPVVFGSATPSIESFYEAEQERFTLLSLPERAANAQLPEVRVVDLTEGYKEGHPSILTEELHARLEQTLKRKEQAIIFLNRRAYSPFIICRDCGEQMMCPQCAVSLSYHRRDKKLRCHHCGYSTRPPDICPKCDGHRLSPFGIGTEKVEEAIANEFPDVTVARLDRDIASRKGALEQTLALFRTGEIQVLVGTQMVAKGLDFPNVTLVGVIAADLTLNIPDFRSSERTYQLLSQVSGRAGRGSSPGSVVIQTFNPDHIAIQSAKEHSFLPFYEALKQERELAGYPPFRRLLNILFTGESRTNVVKLSHEVADRLESALPEAEVLGPVDCALERIQKRWRRHVLLKMDPLAPPKLVQKALASLDTGTVQVTLDVDPYSLM